jgi:membrane dipeptidase
MAADWHNLEQTIHVLAHTRNYFLAQPERFILVDTVDDVLRAKQEGKLAVSFHLQGSNPLEGEVAMVELYYQLGVRHIILANNMKNVIGDGGMERTDSGLSRLGVALVEEMNRVGMIVDGTHAGYRTTMDMMEVSKDPVIFSHSNSKALWDIPICIRDDQIKACAKTGGVIGILGMGIFLGDNDATTETFFRHIDYMASLVGPEHVGIGTNWIHPKERNSFPPSAVHNPMELHQDDHFRASGGTSRGPDWKNGEFVSPTQLPEVTELMLKRGYSEQEVRGILGENFLRVAKQVWK